jgi:glycosyltransferase involved in cell wall biosynthesis
MTGRHRFGRDRGVLMVANGVMPDVLGGLQRYVRELAGAIVARGVPVTVLVRRVSPEFARHECAQDGVEIRRFDVAARGHPLYAALYPVASLGAVARAMFSTSRIIHVHFALQGAAPALVGAPYVQTFQAPVYRELLPEHQDRYALPTALRGSAVAAVREGERLVARRASATIVLTRYMRDQLAVLPPRAARRAEVIPGGLHAERFCPGPGIDHPIARNGYPLLFTARRFVPRTGVSELVQAMPYVLAELPHARLAIAGDGPLVGEIRSMIARLSLVDSVFLLGRVSEEDLVGWYRAASLFVLPTQELEGFGLSTIEALACGTPAVGTPVGGTPEILDAIDSRLLAPGTAPRDLAAGILALTMPEGLLASLARDVRNRVVPSMTWPAIADRHLEIYERMWHE